MGSVVAVAASAVLDDVPDAQVEEVIEGLQRECERVETQRLRWLGEFDRRRLYERDGHLSTASWLASRFKVGWGSASELVRLSRALEEMPQTAQALNEGEISVPAVRVLAWARETHEREFGPAEPRLVEAARLHSVPELRRAAAYWRQEVERRRGPETPDDLHRRRHFHASISLHGMVRVHGELDPETGEYLLTALRSVSDAEARSAGPQDDRTPDQRTADALAEVCRRSLSPDGQTVAGERPHVTLTVDEAVLRNVRARLSELDHTGPVDAQTARMIACDSSVMRVVMSGRSEPLDIGRRTPVVPAGMRRAVIVRDRGCRFPGCDRRHTWCDAHHVVHWADGGPTEINNLVLLCRRHHRLVHRGFRLSLEDDCHASGDPTGRP